MTDRRPTRTTAADLMRLELPPTKYAVPGYVPVGLTVLASRPKIGKSWLALNMALAVASGGMVLGEGVEQGNVLYLALEDSAQRLQGRLRKMLGGEAAPKTLDLWLESAPLDKGGLESVLAWADASPRPRLIVLDTWQRLAPSKPRDANDYEHLARHLGPLQRAGFDFEAAVIVIHHTRKSSTSAMRPDEAVDSVLGSTGMTSIADAVLVLTRERGGADAILHVTGRDVAERAMGLKFDPRYGLWTVTGKAETVRLPSGRRAVLEAVKAGYSTPKAIAEHLGRKPSNISRDLTALLGDDLLTTDGTGTYHVRAEPPQVEGHDGGGVPNDEPKDSAQERGVSKDLDNYNIPNSEGKKDIHDTEDIHDIEGEYPSDKGDDTHRNAVPDCVTRLPVSRISSIPNIDEVTI